MVHWIMLLDVVSCMGSVANTEHGLDCTWGIQNCDSYHGNTACDRIGDCVSSRYKRMMIELVAVMIVL